MSYIAKELLLDCSTAEEFCFSLRCAECKEVWKSTPVRFSKAGIVPATEGKKIIFDTLYRREKEAALNRAIAEAEQRFNKCPICHRFVCDHCFLICDDLDMCQSCANSLEERGEYIMVREVHAQVV